MATIGTSKRTNRLYLRAWLDAYKMRRGCFDCGYNQHPAALDFDHVVAGKKKNVSACSNLDEAIIEIEKCVVRCANCHRIRHSKHGRMGAWMNVITAEMTQ